MVRDLVISDMRSEGVERYAEMRLDYESLTPQAQSQRAQTRLFSQAQPPEPQAQPQVT